MAVTKDRHPPALQLVMAQMFQTYLILFIAIMFEVIGTTLLQRSEQFTRLLPTLGMALCYLAAFYCLSLVLRAMPLGITYAIWSGLGIVLVSIIGVYAFNQRLDTPAILGLGLIIAGVVIVNLFSKSVGH